MKKLISLIVTLSLLTVSVHAATFSDTGGHWAEADIDAIARLGAVSGYGDGRFGPDAKITRSEYATILSELYDLPTTRNSVLVFDDVNRGDWFAPYALNFKALVMDSFAGNVPAALGSGYGRSFGGTEYLTRIEAAAGLLAFYGTGGVAPEEAAQVISAFNDRDTFAGDSVTVSLTAAAVLNGLMKGDDLGCFRPYDTITRAEVCALMNRAHKAHPTAGAEITQRLSALKDEADQKLTLLSANFMTESKKNEKDANVIGSIGGVDFYEGNYRAFLLSALYSYRSGILGTINAGNLNQAYSGTDAEYIGLPNSAAAVRIALNHYAGAEVLMQTAEQYGLIDSEVIADAIDMSSRLENSGFGDILRSVGISGFALDRLALGFVIEHINFEAELAAKGLSQQDILAVADTMNQRALNINPYYDMILFI